MFTFLHDLLQFGLAILSGVIGVITDLISSKIKNRYRRKH